MSDPCCQLQLNPDITGIGVRVALYAQIMLGWTLSCVWPDTFAKNARTGYMTAIALIIAAFIQLKTQTLSLLDGIVVSLITSMMITFAIASSPPGNKTGKPEGEGEEPKMDPDQSRARYLTQFCFVAFWGAWCYNMWHNPGQFGLKGDQAGCPTNYNVTIVVFGREVHATDPRMRAAAIALVTLGFIVAIGSLFLTLETLLSPAINLFRKTVLKKDPHEDPILRGIRFNLQCMSFATLVYLIVSTELTIRKNDPEKSTSSWSYGQTIALILLLQQIMDICSTIVEKREGRKKDNDKDSSNETELAPWAPTTS